VPIVQWLEHHYLDLVDYAAPTNPVVRKPVNIPGELQGIAYDGALLYTVGQRAATGGGAEREQWLDASAYDGVEAHLVDSLALANQAAPRVLVSGATVFLARPAPDTNSAPQLESWTLPGTGKFTKLSGAALTQPAQYLAAFDELIAVQNSNEFQLFDARNPAVLTSIGSGGPPGCVGFSLYQADGSATRGLWLPLGPFGVYNIGLGHTPAAP
jgi:hypothetical protein